MYPNVSDINSAGKFQLRSCQPVAAFAVMFMACEITSLVGSCEWAGFQGNQGFYVHVYSHIINGVCMA